MLSHPLLRTLIQPQWIAAIASVGVHGALFAAGPTFSSLGQSPSTAFTPDNERQVPLIELSPQEQQNLPRFTQPSFGLIPSDDLYGFLTPDNTPSRPAPQPSAPPAASSLPNRPITPFGFSPVNPGRRSPILLNPRPNPLANRPRPQIPNPMPGISEPAESAPPPTHQGPTAQDLQPAPNPPPEDDPDSLAVNPGGPEGEEGPTNRLAAYLQALTYNEVGTREDEYLDSATAWQGAVAEAGAIVVPPAPLDGEEPTDPEASPALATLALTLPYQERLCLSPAPTPAIVGLWVLPEDPEPDETTLALTPVLLRSSGYPFLNEMAVEAAAILALPPSLDPPTETNPTAEPATTEPATHPGDGPENGPEGEPENSSERLEIDPAADPTARLDNGGEAPSGSRPDSPEPSSKNLPPSADTSLQPNQAYQIVVTIDYDPADCIEPNSLLTPAPAPVTP